MFINIAVSLPISDLKEIIRHLPWLYYHPSDHKLRDINNKKYLSFTIDDTGRVSAIQVWRNKKTFAKLLTNLPDRLSNALRYKGLRTIFEPTFVKQEALLNKLSVFIKNCEFDRALAYLADNPIAIKGNVFISSNSAFFYALLIRQFQKKHSKKLEKIIYSLRKKNCKLSISTEFDLLIQEDFPDRDALLQQEEQLFNTAMLVRDCLQGNVASNQQFLAQIQQSILWKKSEPEFTPELMPLDVKQFEGTLKDSPHFECIAAYFIAVKNLFLQPEECLKHVSQLEKRLSRELPQLKLANNKPHAYLFDGKLSWPLPEEHYQSESKLAADHKDGKLLTILAEELSKHSIVEKGFWHTFLYVKPEIALEMLANGDLFVEKNYFPIANTHGYVSHPLQWLILSNLPLPEGFTLKEMLRYSVSKDEISINGISIWDYMFDCFRLNNFCSPQTINATIMGSKGEHYCPTLSAYLRSHFWGRYRRSALESNTLIPVLLFSDLENVFTKDQQFVDLEKHYKQKRIGIMPYSDERLDKNKLTLFSKGIPPRLLAKLAERINSADDLLQELSSVRAEGHYSLIMEAIKSKLPLLFTSIDRIQRVFEKLPEATRLFVVKEISKQPTLFITSLEKCQFYVNLFSTTQVKDVIPSIPIQSLIQTVEELERLLLAIPQGKRETIFWSFNSSILQCSEEVFNDLASSIELNVACSLSNKFNACLCSKEDWQKTNLVNEIKAISTFLFDNYTKNLMEIKSFLREYIQDDTKYNNLQSSELVRELFSYLDIQREVNSPGMGL